jgi:hypothetical protein
MTTLGFLSTLLPCKLALVIQCVRGRLASNRSSKKLSNMIKNRKFFAEIRFAHLVLDRHQNLKRVNT